MASVSLRKLEKSYGALRIVKGIDLEIADGEFVVFVGPSGCGKSTTLRMVAGLESITGGEIRIGNTVVNTLPPRGRDIAMVFQDYALYPHKTVRENMGFSLKVRGVAQSEANQRINEAAEMLGIGHLLERRPGQLSGGQRQRVAMGRAIVRRPQVFLFDEPLSNLDAKLRGQVRTEIKRLHQQIGTTIIYVTHDQVEAMTLADRIVILKNGEIEQVGTPDEVYNKPQSVFVGGFVGSPAMNFARGRMSGDKIVFGNGDSLASDVLRLGKSGALDGREMLVGIRPEHFGDVVDDAAVVSAQVQVVEPLGSDTLVHFNIGGDMLTARMAPDARPTVGETIRIGVDPSRIHLFDAESQRVIN
ncbi:sn-glycerol-3-phosphate ABC transporter ATP-binding protein UgpC [uncultured Agrobacterium sp.]|uniref:ABC transporter ATP-binding protein n=1 Tax=uncultured Agrobacterium sp. TaxID=157277 RepID=UPI00258D68F8|nr:sn-glycerol-3-phosphate ABC transporter ATP-binding protein UgpC [uncultured Agrobacterium sp.]